MAARGSDIRAVNVGSVDHDGTILVAAPLILKWLETFPAEPPASNR
jgi:hypothetical protein